MWSAVKTTPETSIDTIAMFQKELRDLIASDEISAYRRQREHDPRIPRASPGLHPRARARSGPLGVAGRGSATPQVCT